MSSLAFLYSLHFSTPQKSTQEEKLHAIQPFSIINIFLLNQNPIQTHSSLAH